MSRPIRVASPSHKRFLVFALPAACLDIPLAVAIVPFVIESASWPSALSVWVRAVGWVGLVHWAECRCHVFQLIIDRKRYFCQPDDQTNDQDRSDQNQLGWHQEAIFVINQLGKESCHRVVPHGWQGLVESKSGSLFSMPADWISC